MSDSQQNQWMLLYLFQEKLLKIQTRFKEQNGVEQPVFDIIEVLDIDPQKDNQKLYQQIF